MCSRLDAAEVKATQNRVERERFQKGIILKSHSYLALTRIKDFNNNCNVSVHETAEQLSVRPQYFRRVPVRETLLVPASITFHKALIVLINEADVSEQTCFICLV